MILTVALYPAGPSGAYSPDGGGMGYMMDGGAAAAAAMMHRPPADPMAFHSEYHYPPQYYGHHLWRKETTARNDNISITRLSLLHSPSTSFFLVFVLSFFPFPFCFVNAECFRFPMSDAPSLLSTTREQEEGKEKKTHHKVIYIHICIIMSSLSNITYTTTPHSQPSPPQQKPHHE